MKNKSTIKTLSVGVIISLIALLFSPIINANVNNKVIDQEFVEFSTETHGLDSTAPHTIKLTHQESIKVIELIDEIKGKLDKIKSEEETINVFEEAISKMNIYGLLPKGMTIKKALRLVIAVVIIVGISFTTVVGYNNIESNIGVSPLFNIRSSKAIDEDSGDLSCEYVGKGKSINLLLPNRDDKTVLFQKFIERINTMDDKIIQKLLTTTYQLNKDTIEEDNNVVIEPLATSLYTICGWFPGCIPYMIMAGVYALLFGLFLIFLKITGFTTDPGECYTEYLPCL